MHECLVLLQPLRALRPSASPEIVLEAFDIVFAEIFAGLYFYKHQVACADVLDPVALAAGYIHRLAYFDLFNPAVAGKERVALNDEPVLIPPVVALEAQPFPRVHRDPLDLVIVRIGQVLEKTPGTSGILNLQFVFP